MNLIATWRKRRACFHHEHISGLTWVVGSHIYSAFGRERVGRMYRCSSCGRKWKRN